MTIKSNESKQVITVLQAIKSLRLEIAAIAQESPTDDAAWEWREHLEYTVERLERGELSVEAASEELGMKFY